MATRMPVSSGAHAPLDKAINPTNQTSMSMSATEGNGHGNFLHVRHMYDEDANFKITYECIKRRQMLRQDDEPSRRNFVE